MKQKKKTGCGIETVDGVNGIKSSFFTQKNNKTCKENKRKRNK